MVRPPALAALSIAAALVAQPALAGSCVVDYETFEIREYTSADPGSMLEEQSPRKQDWYINNEVVTVRELRFTKYGLPRILLPDEVRFWAFINSVPVTVETTSGDEDPEIIYILESPNDCGFQPYQRVME